MSKKRKPVAVAPDIESKPYRFWSGERDRASVLWGELKPNLKWLCLVVFLAGLLRFVDISNASLWMDEITILEEASAGKYQVVSYKAHFTHLIPVSIILQTLGQSAFALRVWGAVLGTLACGLLYLVGLFAFGKREAFWLGLFAAVNCFLVMYSQDGNYYGGVTFYFSVQLLCYVLFFRGMPYTAIPLFLLTAGIAYKNHPISSLPSTIVFGGMVVGLILFPSIRDRFIAWKVANWKGRPALPILILIAVLGVYPFYTNVYPRLSGFLASVINPGEGTLTNVALDLYSIWTHVGIYLLNFFRTGEVDRWLVLLPVAAALVGLVVCLHRAIIRREPLYGALAGLAILVPLGSYLLLFSLNLNRNFNIRYFIFITPVLLMMVALGIEFVSGYISSGRLKLIPGAAYCLLFLGFTFHYLWTDTSNYDDGARFLSGQFGTEDRLLLSTRNDRVEGYYYLNKYNLPTVPPRGNYLYQPAWPNLLASSFPAMMKGDAGTWIVSAWRYVEMPDLYALYKNGLKPEFTGTSKWGHEHDFLLYRWDVGDRVVFPNAASEFEVGADGDPALIIGPGGWNILGPGVPVAHTSEGADRLSLSPPGHYRILPVLDANVHYDLGDIRNPPIHPKYYKGDLEGVEYLRNERDGHYDFILYAERNPRTVVVKLLRRDESDKLLDKNSERIPSGMLVGIAVDGIHRGFWNVPDGARELVEIPIDLNLSPGNHRVSVWGLQPRLKYTPFFPWDFVGLDWTTDSMETVPSLEESGQLTVSPGWTELPNAGKPGAALNRGWTVSGIDNVVVDPALKAPAGDPAVRIDIPGDTKNSLAFVSPPMPVQEGTIATVSYFLKYDGLEHVELSPAVVFLDSDGRQITGTLPANGPNYRGTTLGSWVRVPLAVPVPAGAGYMAVGFIGYPYDGDSTGATIHVGSFITPGMGEVMVADPVSDFEATQ